MLGIESCFSPRTASALNYGDMSPGFLILSIYLLIYSLYIPIDAASDWAALGRGPGGGVFGVRGVGGGEGIGNFQDSI